MEFKKTVEERFSPIVVVAASNDVERTCSALGTTFVQMLRPFRFYPKEAHIRTAKDTEIITVRNFSVRFLTLANVKGAVVPKVAMEEDKFAKHTGAMLREFGEKSQLWGTLELAVGEALTKTDLVHPAGQMRSVSLTPWFDRFRHEYLHNVRFNHIDTFDHPVGAMVAVSSASADPISEFKALYPQRPTDWNLCGVDSNWATYYVLVHDTAVPRDYERVLKAMGEAFGPGNCRALLLNTKESSDANSHVWQGTFNRIEDSPTDIVAAKYGRLDLTSIGSLVEQYMAFALFPFLERRVHSLVQVVAEKRQGALSKMVSWFRSEKPQQGAVPDLVTTPAGDPRFSRESVEMQCRRLADLCFMLHDYENASNYYKLLRTDLTASERPWIKSYLASCLEAYGLCLVLQGKGNISSRKETKEDNKLDSAYEMYREAGEKELAYRCSLLLFQVYFVKGINDRASQLLQRAWSPDTKTPILYSAICSEQAALCYLNLPGFLTQSAVTHVRKTALYLTLAGYRYQKEQAEHSIRCYRLALMIYGKFRGTTWVHIWEHVNDSLGRLAQRKSNGEECVMSISRMFEIVCPSMKLVSFSERITRDLLTSLDNTVRATKSSVYHNLPFPVVKAADVTVHFTSLGYVEEARARAHFAEMDDELRSYLISTRRGEGYLLHPQSKAIISNTRDIKLVSGEAVNVEVKIRNPLAVEIRLQDVHILYRTSQDPQPREAPCDVGESWIEVILPPCSLTTVTLRFTPIQPGIVRVVGMGLTHAGSVRGTIFFDNARHLECQVFDVMPCLDVSLQPLSKMMFEGQIARLELTLANVSSIPMTRVVLKLSTRNVHILQLCHNITKDGEGIPLTILDMAVCPLPQDYIIQPWESTRLTMYVCTSRGTNVPSTRRISNYIAMLISYSNDSPPITTRLYKFLHTVQVMSAPSLAHIAMPASSRTASSPPDTILAGLQVRNSNPLCHNIRIVQVSALSKAWVVKPVTGGSAMHPSLFAIEAGRDCMYYAAFSRKPSSASDTLSMFDLFTEQQTSTPANVLAGLKKALPGAVSGSGLDLTKWPFFSLIVQTTQGAGDLDVAPPASQEVGFSFYQDKGGAKPTDEIDVDLCSVLQPVAIVCVWAFEIEGAVIVGLCTTSLCPKAIPLNPPRPLWETHPMGSDRTPYLELLNPAKSTRTIKMNEQSKYLAVGCILTSVQSESVVYHNFLATPCREIKAKIIVKNTTLQPHTMNLRLLQTSYMGSPDKCYGISTYRWIGKSQFRFVVPADGEHTVDVAVVAHGPGIVNLKRLVLQPTDGSTLEMQLLGSERWIVNVIHSTAHQPPHESLNIGNILQQHIDPISESGIALHTSSPFDVAASPPHTGVVVAAGTVSENDEEAMSPVLPVTHFQPSSQEAVTAQDFGAEVPQDSDPAAAFQSE